MKKSAVKSPARIAYLAGCCIYKETTMVSMSAAINGGSLQAMEYCQISDGLSKTKDVAMIAVALRVRL